MASGELSLLFVPPILLAIVLIGASLLRAGVSLTNSMLGPEEPIELPRQQHEVQTGDALQVTKDLNPYSAPASYAAPLNPLSTTVVPEPGRVKACGIVLAHVLNSGLIHIVFIRLMATLLVGFLVAPILYRFLLPTTFGKAAIVYVFQVLIALVIGIGLGTFALLSSVMA